MDQLSTYQLASQILYINTFSPAQARNAYSAMILIPCWDQLRFCPLLLQCKRTWNYSQAKYSTFWDADILLKTLLAQYLDWKSVEQVRNRLIIVCRILNLFRSIALARTLLCKTKVGDTTYVLTKRKKSEKASVGGTPKIARSTYNLPSHIDESIRKKMTALHVPSGSQLLRQVKPPDAPICNNTVGSITRSMLTSLGINTAFWGPHSTRGAGVQMYKHWA